jgi:curved DNA-binding protein CbpA
MNPYDVLEISPGASADEIKAAYHAMAKQWHPDRFTGEAKAEAERRFRLLAEAFSMLKDTGRRDSAATPLDAAPRPAAAGADPAGPAIQLDSGAKASSANKTVDEWYNEAKSAFENKAYDRGLGLIQYAIRMDAERAEFQALYAKLLEQTGGDKRQLVRALETALRLNNRDVDSTILLAQTFQNLGMHARASRLWSTVHNLAPGHAVFTSAAASKKTDGKGSGSKTRVKETPSLGEQFNALMIQLKDVFDKLLKRG